MTMTEAHHMRAQFKYEHQGNEPTKWFISERAWWNFVIGLETNMLCVVVNTGDQSSELLGIPVYRVIEDGIWECR